MNSQIPTMSTEIQPEKGVLHFKLENSLKSIPGTFIVKTNSIYFSPIKKIESKLPQTSLYLSSIKAEKSKFSSSKYQIELDKILNEQFVFNILNLQYSEQMIAGNLLTDIIRAMPSIQSEIDDINEKIAKNTLKSHNTAKLYIHSSSKLWEYQIDYQLNDNGEIQFSLPENIVLRRFIQYENRATVSILDNNNKPIQYRGYIRIEQNYFYFSPQKMEFGSKSKFETYIFEENLSSFSRNLAQYAYRKTKFYFQLFRIHFLFLSLIPIIATSVLMSHKGFNLDYFLLVAEIVIITSVQIASNLMNDYFDDKSNSDEYVMLSSSFTSGTKFIQIGLVDSIWVFATSVILLLIGIALGVLLIFTEKDIILLQYGVAGVLVAVFYSVPPIKLAYRWFGDMLFSFSLSFILISGTLYLQSGKTFELFYLPLLIIMALNVNVILMSGNINSNIGELAANKTSLVSRIGVVNAFYLIGFQVSLAILSYNILIFNINFQTNLILTNLVYLIPILKLLKNSPQNSEQNKNSLFGWLFLFHIVQFLSFCLILLIF